MLHPSLRAKWFNRLGDGWESKAEALFTHVFGEYAAEIGKEMPAKPTTTPSAAPDSSGLDEICHVDFGDTGNTTVNTDSMAELKRYLAGEGGTAGSLSDPLSWWKVSLTTICSALWF